MTPKQEAAMQQALEALEHHTAIKHPQQRCYRDDAIEALREALAEPAQEEIDDLRAENEKLRMAYYLRDAAAGYSGCYEENEANSRLIAAAPELLSIAQRVSEWERKYPAHRVYSDGKIRSIVAEMKAIVNDADAVIAKVEDRT